MHTIYIKLCLEFLRNMITRVFNEQSDQFALSLDCPVSILVSVSDYHSVTFIACVTSFKALGVVSM